MNKKRKRAFFTALGGLIISLFLINIVSAAPYGDFGYNLRQGSENVIEIIVGIAEPFIDVILGGEEYTGLLLFEKLLLFVILASVIYLSLDRLTVFDDQKGVKWIICIIVPILSLRFIDVIWLNTILLQYQVLGIALLGILPFIIYLFFLHNESFDSTVRKIGWVFFIVVYLGLWSTSDSNSYAQVYFWTAIIAFVFLFFDGSIHRYFDMMRWRESGAQSFQERIAKIEEEITTIQNSNWIPDKKKDKLIKRKQKEIERLSKYA